MIMPSAAFTKQRLCIGFASLKHACPKGIYVAPVLDEPLAWTGVLFLRKGPYANAVLRFRINFPEEYPERPPVITFLSDVFHPLVTPVTTYTHTTRDLGVDTVSSADEDRLPPGGFALRHGFPEWFEGVTVRAPKMHPKSVVSSGPDVPSKGLSANGTGADSAALGKRLPHIVEVLQYLRVAFDTESVLDSIPLDVAVNSGACHAWRSYRSKVRHSRMSPPPHGSRDTSEAGSDRSTSPRQQPGGARRPGEWNWQGVWEDRVRKSIQASNSEAVLFGGGDGNDVINFLKMDEDMLEQLVPARATQAALALDLQ